VGVVGAVWLVVLTWRFWLLVFVALVLAAAMLPVVRAGSRYGVPRGLTVMLIYAIAAGTVTLVAGVLWPRLLVQGRELARETPGVLTRIRGWMGAVSIPGVDVDVGAALTNGLGDLVRTLVSGGVSATAGVAGLLAGGAIVLVLAAYIVSDAEVVGHTLLRWVPASEQPRAYRLGRRVLHRMGGYVWGQIVASLVVGVILSSGLALIGVRYPLLIGAVATVLNVVPWIGSFIAGIVAVFIALGQSPSLALGTIVLFVATNVVEGKLLVPLVIGRATGLHPLAALLAFLLGAELAGLIGALAAVPLLAGLTEILRAWDEADDAGLATSERRAA
jgi:predicted PurR-regulated permease PerM